MDQLDQYDISILECLCEFDNGAPAKETIAKYGQSALTKLTDGEYIRQGDFMECNRKSWGIDSFQLFPENGNFYLTDKGLAAMERASHIAKEKRIEEVPKNILDAAGKAIDLTKALLGK